MWCVIYSFVVANPPLSIGALKKVKSILRGIPGWKTAEGGRRAGNIFSPSPCSPPPAPHTAGSRARLHTTPSLPWLLARKSQRSPQTEKAPRLFVVIADLNASLQGPPTRCFSPVRVCGASRRHE